MNEKIKELEKRIEKLEKKTECHHGVLVSRYGKPVMYFTMGGTGYHICQLCGNRVGRF